jgi:hypothetical protein
VVGSDELKRVLEDDDRFEFSFAGNHHFKGIKGEIPVHRVRRR